MRCAGTSIEMKGKNNRDRIRLTGFSLWRAGLHMGKAGVLFKSVWETVVTLVTGRVGLLSQRSSLLTRTWKQEVTRQG